MDQYQEVMVARSEFVMKNRVKRPLAEDWRLVSYPACNETSLSHTEALDKLGARSF